MNIWLTIIFVSGFWITVFLMFGERFVDATRHWYR